MILLTLLGCQPESAPYILPTFVPLPLPTVTQLPTRIARTIPTRAVTATVTPYHTLPPTLIPLPSPTFVSLTALPQNETITFGQSVFGRPLIARRHGTGEQVLMLVGGIHGGWESNTAALMDALSAHFEASPDAILPGAALMIIPQLNPDGLTRGRVLEGRFNDHGVDLNRNWGCGWQPDAYFQQMQVDAGETAMSEPETQALAALITETQPALVLFYHSAADGIFTGDCQGDDAGAEAMAQVLGEATGYSFGAGFSAYPVTGTAPNWVASLGIPSADVELETWREPEFERNLRGVLALQCWVLGIVCES
ncbi:MAG: hypothetical protein H7Y11_07235 [Armatimonadetes bacterium]|nr:hypothetical protein [Anaerolineae bacterium]